MKRSLVIALSMMCLGTATQANVFNLGAGFTNLETVTVGDVGNAADTTGYGSVAYTYNIGKYEVTAKQYCDFLNHKASISDPYGLYNSNMWDYADGCKIQRTNNSGGFSYTVADDYANRPVNWVSYWDACRFANWLGNGQGDGDTEVGAYTLTATGITNNTVTRNTNWNWAVTNRNEWYKAAYYKGGTGTGYWLYTTASNTAPGRDLADASGNNANYYAGSQGFPIDSGIYYTTVVGEFQNSDSAYGTFDQGGNVWEWNESLRSGAFRGLHGGSFGNDVYSIRASERDRDAISAGEDSYDGFRVVQAVPEPSSILTLLGGLGSLVMLRRSRR